MAKKAASVVKVLREATTVVTIDLDISEIDDIKNELIEQLRRADDLKIELKTEQTKIKNKIQAVAAKIAASRSMIDSRKRDVEIPVREVLLSNNEVATMRSDTDEEIGRRRTASAAEMQDELPLGGEFQ